MSASGLGLRLVFAFVLEFVLCLALSLELCKFRFRVSFRIWVRFRVKFRVSKDTLSVRPRAKVRLVSGLLLCFGLWIGLG